MGWFIHPSLKFLPQFKSLFFIVVFSITVWDIQILKRPKNVGDQNFSYFYSRFFAALSDSKLILHKQKHQASEMQCLECKLAFTNHSTMTAHLQITGHLNRPGKCSFDCQYCTKKLQSAINLFSHIKNTHYKDAKRDGIVGLEELEDTDDDDQDEESEEEYIIPEILTDNEIQKDKVRIFLINILSGVRQRTWQKYQNSSIFCQECILYESGSFMHFQLYWKTPNNILF